LIKREVVNSEKIKVFSWENSNCSGILISCQDPEMLRPGWTYWHDLPIGGNFDTGTYLGTPWREPQIQDGRDGRVKDGKCR